jgi:hypothetical protein
MRETIIGLLQMIRGERGVEGVTTHPLPIFVYE